MFRSLVSNNEKLNKVTKDVVYSAVITFENDRAIFCYLPGGSLEVDTNIDRWLYYKDELVCFINSYRDDRGIHVATRLVLDIDSASDAYVEVRDGPIPIASYVATEYLKPILYRN